MKKILYHGSELLIETPEFGKDARHNDYGRGFYCTENIDLAKEWACAKQKNGYVNIYDFVSGVISLEKLSEAMRLGKLGEQIYAGYYEGGNEKW